MSLAAAWQQFSAGLVALDPAFRGALRPPASPQALEHFTLALPAALPEGFLALYRENDGEEGEYPTGVFFGQRFLPLHEIPRLRDEWAEELAAGYIEREPPSDARIGEEFPSLSHLPVFADGNGNFIGLDVQPGPGGRFGQVIHFGADLLDTVWVCGSLREFIAAARDALARGAVNVRRDARSSPRAWMTLSSSAPKLLDVLKSGRG